MKATRYHEAISHICAEKIRIRRFKKGAIIVTSGDQSDAVYFINQGDLKICLAGEDGKEVVLNVIGAGESFGELAVLTGEPRSADVIAKTPCELMIIDKADYLHAVRSDPGTAPSHGSR